MERINNILPGTNLERNNPNEERREFYFRSLVQSHLIETMKDSLHGADFSDEEIGRVIEAFAGLSDEEQRIVLALPYEIRQKLLQKYQKEIEGGTNSPEGMIADIVEKNKKYGYTLGFHLSDREIKKVGEAWNVVGSELDDRDDRLMAYYSEDYLHRYKKKAGNFLYIVRAEIHPDGPHRRDLNNKWGRAPMLSIIDCLDMNQVEKEIDESLDAEMKNAAAK